MKKVLLLWLVFNIKSFSQTSNLVPSIIPPSPEAANFAKFTELPINLSTGSYGQNVPIYEVKRGKIATNISLGYHGSGIKLEEMASWCGLGWALNAGGLVTRSVRGKPDDIGVNGFLQYSQGKTVQSIQELSGQARLNIYEDIANGCVDAEPDLFYVNANGMSFHFAFEWNNGGLKFSTDQKIKVAYSQNVSGQIIEWRITDDKGSIYKFNVIETTFETPNGSGTHCYPSQSFTSAWYLSEIRDINNENFIYFDYDTYNLRYEARQSESFRQHIGGDTYCGLTTYLGFSSSQTITGKRISQIRTDEDAIKISFSPSVDDRLDNGNLDLQGTSNFKKLDRIVISNQSNNEVKMFKMEYDYSAGRLTLKKVRPQNNNTDVSPPYEFFYQSSLPQIAPVLRSQDHWGYYNGAPNSTLIPSTGTIYNSNGYAANREPDINYTLAGSLNKVILPTGGIIELALEAHDYGYISGATLNEYQTIPVTAQAYVDGTMANNQDLTITMGFTVRADLSGVNTTTRVDLHIRGHNNNGIATAKPITKRDSLKLLSTLGRPSVRVINSTGGVVYPTHTIQGIDEDFTVSLNLPPDSYTLSAYCKFYDSQVAIQDFAEITASFSDYTNVLLLTKPAGGVRVKEQRIYANANDSDFQVIKYSYKMSDNGNRSSGTINAAPLYNYIQNLYCLENFNGGSVIEHGGQYLVRTAQNISQTGTIQDSHIIYREVEVSHQKGSINNGKTRHKFTSYYDYSDGFIDALPIRPNATQPYKRNLLREQDEFRAGNTTPFKANTSLYDNNEKIVLGLRVDKLGGYYEAVNFDQRFLASGYATNFGHPKVIEDIEVIDGISTRTYTDYDSEKQNVVKQAVQSSNNVDNTLINEFYYPQDFSVSTTQTAMVNSNFVGIPLETVTKRINTNNNTSKIISAEYQEFDFSTKLRLQRVKKLNIANGISSGFQYAKDGSPDSRYITEISYGNYDSKGNIREYTLRGNRKTSFLWGYQSQYPIAEIKEASFSEVTTALSAFGQTPASISLVENKATLQGYMNQLRSNLPNTWVNSYTYDPLIGITSQTDPSQININFDYDTFKRLQNIKDRSDNIVKSYQYNYASTSPICTTPSPPIISLSNVSICEATLTASGCSGTVNWNNGSVGNTISVLSKNTFAYSATCTVSSCISAASNNTTFPAVPSGWVINQIGTSTPADCVQENGGTWTIQGKGNTFGMSDNFSFVNQSLSGNAVIVAKLNSISSNTQGMRSGIMIRASSSPTADYFQFFFDSGFQVLSLYKQDNTTGDGQIGFQAATTPQWLRIKKSGNDISVWYSSLANPSWNNETDWTQYGTSQTSIAFNGTYLLGILAYNNGYNNNSITNETQFTNVTIHPF